MKLHLPKVLLAALLSAVSLSSAEDSSRTYFSKPQFGGDDGGLEWWYNNKDKKFYHDRSTSESPQRSSKGPVLVFDNAGKVVERCGSYDDNSNSGNTSDNGGVKVMGNSEISECFIGNWGGSIYVEKGSSLGVDYYYSLKNTETANVACVWVDGTLSLLRKFNCNDNTACNWVNWHIGTSGKIVFNGENVGNNIELADNQTFYLDVIVDSLSGGDGLTNRKKTNDEKTRTIAEINSGGNIYSVLNSNVKFYNTAREELSGVTLEDGGTSISVKYTEQYKAMMLYADGDEYKNVLWTPNGTEENTLLYDETSKQKTSFINGDSVTVKNDACLTAQDEIVVDTLTLCSGDLKLNGKKVIVSTLVLSGSKDNPDCIDLSEDGSALEFDQIKVGNDDRHVGLDLTGTLTVGKLTTDGITFTKKGEGTLILTDKGNLAGGILNIEEGTVKTKSSQSYGQAVLQDTTVNVSAGATYISDGKDGLGYDFGFVYVREIVLNGEKDKVATYRNEHNELITVSTALTMNGYAIVEGTGLRTFRGTDSDQITVTGEGNEIKCELEIRNAENIKVNKGGFLTLSGALNNWQKLSTTGNDINLKGGGNLVVTSSDNGFSHNWNVTEGTTLWIVNANEDQSTATTNHLGTGLLNLSGKSGETEVSTLKTNGNITFANTVNGKGGLSVEAGTLNITGAVTLGKTVTNSGRLGLGEGGSLTFASLDGLDANEATSYYDPQSESTENGYASGASYYVVKAGSDSAQTTLTRVTVGETTYSTTDSSNSLTVDGKGNAIITSQGDSKLYWVNTGTIIYSSSADNAAASKETTGLVLNGGTLEMKENLKGTVGITVKKVEQDKTNTVKLSGEKVTLSSSSVKADEDATWSLDGNGVYDLGSNPTAISNKVSLGTGVSLADTWTGTVSLKDLTIDNDVHFTSLNDLCNDESWVQISNVTGYADCYDSKSDVTANFILKDTDGKEALTFNNGNSNQIITFKGKIKGVGTIVSAGETGGPAPVTFVFTGDVSEWEGEFKNTVNVTDDGERKIEFKDGARSVKASVEHSGNKKLTLNVTNDDAVSFSGFVKKTGEGVLDIVTGGSGEKTFSGGIVATSLSVNGGDVSLNGTGKSYQFDTVTVEVGKSLSATSLTLNKKNSIAGNLSVSDTLTLGEDGNSIGGALSGGLKTIAYTGSTLGTDTNLVTVTGAFTGSSSLSFGLESDLLENLASTVGKRGSYTLLSATGGVNGITSLQINGQESAKTQDGIKKFTITKDGNDIKLTVSLNACEWVGDATTGWTETAGFSGGKMPGADDAAAFVGEGSGTVKIVGDKTVKSILVDATTGDQTTGYTFTGDTVTAETLRVDHGTLTIDNELTKVTGDVHVNNGATLDVSANGTLFFTGDVSKNDGLAATLAGNAGTIKLNKLNCTGNAKEGIKGTVLVSDTCDFSNGQYKGTTKLGTMSDGAILTVTANDNLTVIGEKGTVKVNGNGTTLEGIDTTGANIILGDTDTATSITLANASSMKGGTLKFTIDASAVAKTLNEESKKKPHIIDGSLSLTDGVTLKVNEINSVGNVFAEQNTGILLFIIGDHVTNDGSVTVDTGDCTWLNKHFTNIRVAHGSGNVLGDINNGYYTKAFEGISPNGNAGLTMASDAMVRIDPQSSDPDSMLAQALDKLDAYAHAGNDSAADKLGAALAGASLPALGQAFGNDVQRQLQSIRNRMADMGVNDAVTNEDMPYFNMWINAEGDYRELKQQGTESGYSLSSWGGTVGFDADITPHFTAGLAFTAMWGNFDAKSADSLTADMDMQYLSLFARATKGGWVHTLAGTAGRAHADLTRNIPGADGSLKGDTDGFGIGVMYEVGRVFSLNKEDTASLEPIFNVSYVHSSLDGFTETGSNAALKTDDLTMDTVTFGLGARLRAMVGEDIYNRTSLFECRALLKVDAGDRNCETGTAFAVLPMAAGRVESRKAGAAGGEIGVGLTIPVGTENDAIFLDASAELRSDYTSANASIGYRLTF